MYGGCYKHVYTQRIHMWKIPLEQHAFVINKYLSGKNTIELGKEYGVPHGTISHLLKHHGCTLRDYGHCNVTYPIIEDFFDKIDTQEKAYMLGYLFADGCNTGTRIQIALAETDREILEKFSSLLYPGGKPLSYRKGKPGIICDVKFAMSLPVYMLRLDNVHISQTLSKLGCVPRKTSILQFPDYLSDELLPHFVRGYFDGDGCIYLRPLKTGRLYCNVNLVSSKNFCYTLKNILEKKLGIMTCLSLNNKRNQDIFLLRTTCKPFCYTFLNWLYKDASIYLKRKYEKYILFKKSFEFFSNPNWNACSVCGGGHYGKGLCKKHYRQWYEKNKHLQSPLTHTVPCPPAAL